MNSAIIVAGGTGSRFGGDRPKQFALLAGKPLIQYSLETFDRCTAVDEIIVVIGEAELSQFADLRSAFILKKLRRVVTGASTRAGSVRSGVAAADPASEVIVVHDAARPLVTTDEIERTVAAARSTGAACLTAPVSDTIKKVESGFVVGTGPRHNLRRALTPQAFGVEVVRKMYSADGFDESATDECIMAERLGFRVANVDGSARNIKITLPEDILAATALLGNEAKAFK